MDYADIPSVSQLNDYIKSRLEEDENLQSILVQGEVSNFKLASNGVYYFSLLDVEKNSSINCVLFKNNYQKLKFEIKTGDKVILYGAISVFTGRGSYSLKVYNVINQGLGNKLLQFEELKQKLYKMGLFDEKRKRPINIFPKAIGVISAKNSAALKDIIVNIKRRYPFCDIYVFPCQVQGDGAAKEILKAYFKSQEYDIDTLIIGRGGGSSEDLSAFNDETLIIALSNSKCPIISAVGHEIDLTLIDYIADKRASTPTGAAELATIDVREIKQICNSYENEMKNQIKNKLDSFITDYNYLKDNLHKSIKIKLENLIKQIELYNNRLNDLNPLNILKRGYSLTRKEDKKSVVKSCRDIDKGDIIFTTISDGTIKSTILEVTKNGK